MKGTIYFESEATLAKFLKEFCDSSAVFKVKPYDGGYELEFTGGY